MPRKQRLAVRPSEREEFVAACELFLLRVEQLAQHDTILLVEPGTADLWYLPRVFAPAVGKDTTS